MTKASDDPAGMVDAMRIRSDQRANAQHARNAGDGVGWLTTVDTALTAPQRCSRAPATSPSRVRTPEHSDRPPVKPSPPSCAPLPMPFVSRPTRSIWGGPSSLVPPARAKPSGPGPPRRAPTRSLEPRTRP
ncbi:flagellin [Georgenia yuyongxinii]